MLDGIIALGSSKKYTDEQLKKYQTGNVTVEKGTDGSLTLTAQKGTANESKVTYTKDELKGLGIESISKDSDGNCIVTYTDGTTQNIGSFKGDKGDVGDKGDKGDKGDTGLGIKSIETTESSLDNGENVVTITLTDDTTKLFKILNGSKGSKGDTGVGINEVKIEKNVTDKMSHLLLSYDNDITAFVDLGRVQGKSPYEMAVDNGFIGTEDDWLKSLTAQTMESKIVMSKPHIEDEDVSTGIWYYWQDNKEGTTDTAYKYRLDIPNTQDLVHGKYCFYYNLKWFKSEPTQDVLALTNKDTYKYYLIMDLANISFDIIRETIADGTTTVVEHVQGEMQTTKPTEEYRKLKSTGLHMLGVQCQTLYIGATKETSSEVTIRTGTDVRGFVESATFNSIIGSLGNLLTNNINSIVDAINEVKSDLDTHTDNVDIHVSTTEKETWNKVLDKAEKSDLSNHINDTDIHVSTTERTKWNDTADKVNGEDLVKKADIKTTTLNENSTNDEIYGGKAIYDAIKKNCIGKETVLYEGSISSTGTYTLADDVNNYNFIVINHTHNSTIYRQSNVLTKSEISKCIDKNNKFLCVYGDGSASIYTTGYFNNNNVIISDYNNEIITSITGYKFGEVTVQNTITNPLQPISYSTDEQLTGGTWVDGKPIYRKSWTGTGNPNSFNHNIDSLGDVIKIDGCFSTSTSQWINFAGSDSSGDMYLCRAVVTPTQIVFTRRNYTITKYTLSVEYTKTTDV